MNNKIANLVEEIKRDFPQETFELINENGATYLVLKEIVEEPLEEIVEEILEEIVEEPLEEIVEEPLEEILEEMVTEHLEASMIRHLEKLEAEELANVNSHLEQGFNILRNQEKQFSVAKNCNFGNECNSCKCPFIHPENHKQECWKVLKYGECFACGRYVEGKCDRWLFCEKRHCGDVHSSDRELPPCRYLKEHGHCKFCGIQVENRCRDYNDCPDYHCKRVHSENREEPEYCPKAANKIVCTICNPQFNRFYK